MEIDPKILSWLLRGDPAIRWQVLRDLTGSPEAEWRKERATMAKQGWAARLLKLQDPDGLWAGRLYSPKWISTTYTMLLLRRMGLPAGHPQALKACERLLNEGFYRDGGINYFASLNQSETCVTGMVLSILAYFRHRDERIHTVAGHLLGQQMADHGWNCRSYLGDTHSSFHTTISVLEGLREYEKAFPEHRAEIPESRERAVEFLLLHRLFRSHRTGKIFDPKMTRLSFPPRWHYDILRCLDFIQEGNLPVDARMMDALRIIIKKGDRQGRWKLQQRYSGRTFFEMETVGEPSRWNTLRALRVLQWWQHRGGPEI